MILGIGTDITKIDRFESKIQSTSFLDKIYTKKEQDYCVAKNKEAVASFAARFAVKEAFMKALGTGYAEGVSFTETEVVVNEKGAPGLELSGETKKIASTKGVKAIHVSISHEKEYALAFVILEA